MLKKTFTVYFLAVEVFKKLCSSLSSQSLQVAIIGRTMQLIAEIDVETSFRGQISFIISSIVNS
jgi:hypothetical protein